MSIERVLAVCEQEGVVLRREALALGLEDQELRRLVRSGVLIRVRQGAYVLRGLWESVDAGARHLLLLRAVMKMQSGQVAASHLSAALVHGMSYWDVPLDRVHVTRLDDGASRVEKDAHHHRGKVSATSLTNRSGFQVVEPVRAAVEAASLVNIERGLVMLDSGLHQQLFTVDELHETVAAMDGWPWTRKLKVVSRLADGRSESVGESRSRHLCWVAGLPAPELQYPVYDGGRLVAVTDFAWPQHGLLGEFDGKIKYTRLMRDGEDPGDVVFREKQREDRIRELTGWPVVRLTWPMLAQPDRTAAYLRSKLRVAA